MTNQSIKQILKAHNLSIMQLCAKIGINRSTYYERCYRQPKEFKNRIIKTISKLSAYKGDAHNAD